MEDPYVLSGWWRRVVAYTIDVVLVALVSAGAFWVLGFDFDEYGTGEETLLRQVAVQNIVLGLVPPLAPGGYLLPLADGENRAGHDIVARTRVIRTRPRQPAEG